MKLRYHKYFKKQYNKLPSKIRDKVDDAVIKFKKNPFDKSLKNHSLKGTLSGNRAFSVSGDVRVVFREIDNYVIVIMLDVGTHNQVY